MIMLKKILLLSIIITTSLFCTELPEKKIAALICSYNNGKKCEQVLASVLMQEYSNWKAYFIDDASSQHDADYAQQFLAHYDPLKKITVIKNNTNRGALYNQWHTQNSSDIDNDTILVFIDGDDFLVHNQVFKRVNEEYHNGAYVTYGQYVQLPSKTLGYCRPIPSEIINANQWRNVPLPLATSHLRTCYAGLIRQIPLQNLLREGKFLPVCGDIALFWPACEQGAHRVHFISDILYAYQETDINDYKVRLPLVLTLYHELRTAKRFQPLTDQEAETIITPQKLTNEKADLIIFSYKRPLQLYALLESLQKYIIGLDAIWVLYRVDDEEYAHAYELLTAEFQNIHFVEQSRINPHSDFKQKLLNIFDHTANNYILFAVDDIIVKDYVDLSFCIDALQKTHAYGFYLRLGTNLNYCFNLHRSQPVPDLIHIEPDLFAWQFKYGTGDWAYPNTVDMTLYKKSDIKDALHMLEYNNPSNLEGAWYIPQYVDMDKVGLCYNTSKIINIPLNVVQTERANPNMHVSTDFLLTLFNNGLKIDSNPLHQIDNKSAHMEYTVTFIKRAN